MHVRRDACKFRKVLLRTGDALVSCSCASMAAVGLLSEQLGLPLASILPVSSAVVVRSARIQLGTATKAERRRWASNGHRSPGQNVGLGNQPGSLAALRRPHKLRMICRTDGCSSLVTFMVANRSARAAGRWHFVAGDGCGSRTCSKHNHSVRHRARQLAMAGAVASDKLWLVEWPCDVFADVFQPVDEAVKWLVVSQLLSA